MATISVISVSASHSVPLLRSRLVAPSTPAAALGCRPDSQSRVRRYLYTARAGKKIDTVPEADPLVTVDPPTADPPDEVDEAAWRMIPLLRAAEARWAAMVSPLRDESQPRDPWPWLSVYGPSKRP